MADPHQPPARVRPSVVTISSYLLIFYAILSVISLIIGLTTLGTIQDVYRDAFAGTDAEGAEGVAVFMVAAGSVVSLLFAIGLVVLAMLNNRGKNVARIVTWVVGGIALCCSAIALAGTAASSTMGGETSGNVPSQDEINRRLDEALPSWYEPVSQLLTALSVIVLLVALILLALPKANEFFRRPQQQWEPPVPGGAYPAYPSAPGQPGYPQTPGYPATPDQPGYPQPGAPGTTPGQPEQGGEGQPGSDRPGPPPVS